MHRFKFVKQADIDVENVKLDGKKRKKKKKLLVAVHRRWLTKHHPGLGLRQATKPASSRGSAYDEETEVILGWTNTGMGRVRLPHIYRFYLSLTSPRRVGVRILACTTDMRRGRGKNSGRQGRKRARKPGENLWNAGGKKENISRNDRREEIERDCFYFGLAEEKNSLPLQAPERFFFNSFSYLWTKDSYFACFSRIIKIMRDIRKKKKFARYFVSNILSLIFDFINLIGRISYMFGNKFSLCYIRVKYFIIEQLNIFSRNPTICRHFLYMNVKYAKFTNDIFSQMLKILRINVIVSIDL